jgi:hypothetical protein
MGYDDVNPMHFDFDVLLLLAAPLVVAMAVIVAVGVTVRRTRRLDAVRNIGAVVTWWFLATIVFGIGSCYGSLRLGGAS